MSDHFSAFSFVDRIRDYTRRGPHARGFFTIPDGLTAFPSCLVAEAVGQLASWVAMDHIDFRGRPVAALALETRFLQDVKPGETLELGVELESCDDDAVAYRGWADVDGERALELIDCLGPMLPLDEFDSPHVLRERFDVLCGAGAPAGRFHGIQGFRVEPGAIVTGKSAAATLYVPDAAPFFHDHFPRRPVFPATLLLNEMIQLALNAASNNGARSHLVPERMTNVKVRSFTPPGQVLDLYAELAVSGGTAIVASLTARADGRMVATAQVDIGTRVGAQSGSLMSGAGPSQAANLLPLGGSEAAELANAAASVGVHNSGAGPSQAANLLPLGGSEVAELANAAASVGVHKSGAGTSHEKTSKKRRIAITGIGLVTPVGNDVATTWDALLAGRSGGAAITLFDASGFPVRIAAEVKNFPDAAVPVPRKMLKLANRSHRFALAAAEQAFRDAGIRPTKETATRWGCTVGAAMMTSDYDDLATTHDHSAPAGDLDYGLMLTDPAANDPLAFCRSQATAGVALLTRQHDIRGYATSVHTACASGGQAIGTALKLIRRGAVDYALAGGFDSMISPVGISGFCLLSALSPDNDTPQRASRPFDISRNGFLLGEGAGFVVLEEWEAARRRGARIYAELAGDGNSLSSYRITDSPPDGDGPIQAMRAALADAGAKPADVDYLNAHGTSTPMNDRSESAATHVVFGGHIAQLSVSSTKSTMGHLISAAGAVEVAVCALAIHHGEMPINANLVERDPDCDLNLVTGAPRRQHIRMTMSNSFGFGGSNSCVALRNPVEVDGLDAAGR